MYQCAAERGYEVVAIAEPYRVPDNSNWVGSPGGSTAIYSTNVHDSPPLEKVEGGEGYVAVRWGSIMIISCYAPLSWDLAAFNICLERMGAVVRGANTQSIILAGDFNAKSPAWGCLTPNRRGEILLGWTVSFGLSVLNRGRASTCVRPQGESIVDVTFGSLWVAQKLNSWRVLGDIPIGSPLYRGDHW